jgi:hypothetical protein
MIRNNFTSPVIQAPARLWTAVSVSHALLVVERGLIGWI